LIAQPESPTDDAELDRHLTTVREQVTNTSLSLSRRENLALEMASTLDRAAQAAATPEKRRHRWEQAVDLLDKFLKDNIEPRLDREMRFQAGIYRWATAQSWISTADLSPGDPKSRQQAVAALDDAIERFRSVGHGDNRALDDNVRFRLAEALTDRARLEPPASDGRRSRESEALDLLEQSPGEPELTGFWSLLKADLLRRRGQQAEAEKQLEAVAKSTPPPPDDEIAEVKVPLLLDQKKFTDAIAFLETSHANPSAKALWMVRARLAQLAGEPAAAGRVTIETELFKALEELRKGTSSELRAALLEVAQSGLMPDAGHPPAVWDALAAAYGAAGDPATAGTQMAKAASRAIALGQMDEAASYRLRGGGYLYQAGKFLEADRLLSQVADNPGPASVRAKAGMLRALARGQAVALGLPGASSVRYADALEQQIREFPTDPATDEARWQLGRLAAADSHRDRAEGLWAAIAARSPHWLESRLAILEFDREKLELHQINPDRNQVNEVFKHADRLIGRSMDEARSEADKTELMLARARLDLTPQVGTPESARNLFERIRRLPADPDQQYRARLLRLVALIEMGRYIEAEREAQSHPSWRVGTDLPAYFDAIRLLDQCASTAPSDLGQRRFGLVLKLLIEPVLKSEEELPPALRTELAIRETRALLFTGADREARLSLAAWHDVDAESASDRLLRDLGDTYSRLEVYSHEIDVQRLRMKRNASGSLAWFDARYSLALAYFRSGKLREAAQLIDSTAILHPDLGGTFLHDKFIHLRQRSGVKP
jgi:tetratricopeptide (TPR) repeat protein